MSQLEALKEKFGEPLEIQTNWGKAHKFIITNRLSVIAWVAEEYSSLCFKPVKDKRDIEWRAGDQAAWFREEYPQFEKLNLCHREEFWPGKFAEWLDGVNEAVKLVAK